MKVISLLTLATGLKDRLLPQDVVGRLGGDEFAVLLAEVHGPCAIERLQQIVSDLLLRQNYGVTASIGALVIAPVAIMSQRELIVTTDTLMYEAKRGLRKRVTDDRSFKASRLRQAAKPD